ncbi:MAG: hypothetical protein IIB88_07510 [Chloroflexi bacterium]|nr:hypothetical protein [Chloroflexota bacterium]
MSSLERLIAHEGLPVLRVGAAVRIPTEQLERWASGRYEQPARKTV